MPFCERCGRRLMDNEVCSCGIQNIQQPNNYGQHFDMQPIQGANQPVHYAQPPMGGQPGFPQQQNFSQPRPPFGQQSAPRQQNVFGGNNYNPFAAQNAVPKKKGGKGKVVLILIIVLLLLAAAGFGVWYFLLRDKDGKDESAPDGGDLNASARSVKRAAESALQDVCKENSIDISGSTFIITNVVDKKGKSLNYNVPEELKKFSEEFNDKIYDYDEDADYYAYILVFDGMSCEYSAVSEEFDTPGIGTYPPGDDTFTIYTSEGAVPAEKDAEYVLDDVYDMAIDAIKG